MTRTLHAFSLWLIAPLLMVGLSASTVCAQVRDGAGIFSAGAIQKAEKIGQQLQASRSKQVMLESFAAIPSAQSDNFKTKGKDQFFNDWVRDQATTNHVNGVYILICMDPRHVQVIAGNKTAMKAFPDGDRDQLAKLLVQKLKAGDSDAALTDGFQFVSDTINANLGAAAPAPAQSEENRDRSFIPGVSGGPVGPSNSAPASGVARSFGCGSLVCLGVGALVVFMLVRKIFAGRGASNTGNYAPGYNQPMGGAPNQGGGFGRGLLGGLLGGAIGSWGYDRFARGDQGGNQSGGTGFGSSSSGGDFGSSSGGADTSYTPDSSGGDFGGGGDSGGGGGGDSGGSSGGDF